MVTIRDVARTAGVSIKTVSRVLTGNGYASEETRAKVEQAAHRLGYVPNRAASSLVTGRTMAIGMIVPNISSGFYPIVVLGAETTARKAGYNTFLCNTANDLDQEKRILKYLHETRVDGLIVVSSRLPDTELLVGLAPHRAVVSINRPVPSEVGGNILSDHAGGIGLAVDHLVKSKRQVIAFLAGPEGAYASRERLHGFIQAMKKAGRSVNPNLIVPYNANLEDGYRSVAELLQSEGDDSAVWNEARSNFGCRGTRLLLAQHPEVDGLVCFDDQLAFGAERACVELGRQVPDDIAIVGCNDMPLASQVTPALTTQRVPGFQMGVRAAQLLIQRIQGLHPQDPVVFPHQLIIRASAPAALQPNLSVSIPDRRMGGDGTQMN